MHTPQSAWRVLQEGNHRFVNGEMTHPSQDVFRRNAVATGQSPHAIVLGCSDSRLSPEILFDQGLGDLFVVRTAGQIIDSCVLGSVEYGVAALKAPLLVVLGHESCGALNATADAYATGQMPGGYIRDVVEHVMPSVLRAAQAGNTEPANLLKTHVRESVSVLMSRSTVIGEAAANNQITVVGATYEMASGRIRVVRQEGAAT